MVTTEAISLVLVREEEDNQLSVYYVSNALFTIKGRYSDMEKLSLSLVMASRKLRLHFQKHTIQVLTNFPLKQLLQKPDASGRLLKWAIEHNEFDVIFKSITSEKR